MSNSCQLNASFKDYREAQACSEKIPDTQIVEYDDCTTGYGSAGADIYICTGPNPSYSVQLTKTALAKKIASSLWSLAKQGLINSAVGPETIHIYPAN